MAFRPDPFPNETEPVLEPTDLGTFVRLRREALGMTQEMLAEATSLSHRSISDIELGRSQSPQRRTIDLLAGGLRLTAQQRQTLQTLVPPRSHPSRKQLRLPAGLTIKPDAIDHLPIPDGAEPPWPNDPLLGRQLPLDQTVSMLTGLVGLLTLTGPPGVGKTRFAIEIARHPDIVPLIDAVAFVPLAQARTITEAVGQINAVLGLTVSAPPAPITTLLGFLRRMRLLLILDNVEQVSGIEPLLTELVTGSTSVRLFVTSRRTSGLWPGRQLALPPLELPAVGPSSELPAPDFASIASVAFVLERLRRDGVRLRLTTAVMADLAAICRAMDGLPLALELAAARLRSMSPHDLLHQIQSRRAYSPSGGVVTDDRYGSLREAIGWSIDLLTPDARSALARVSVFLGGFTSEAAAIVVRGTDATVDPRFPPVVEVLAELVDQHLLVIEHSGRDEVHPDEPHGRYHLLETVRDAALVQLERQADVFATRYAHACWALELVEVAEQELLGANPGTCLRRLDREVDNIREATDCLAELGRQGDLRAAEMGLDLSARLWQYWRVRGLSDEGRRRIERSLEVAEQVLGLGPHPSRARALNNLGILILDTGDTERARALFETSLMMSRAIGDGRDVADTVNNLGVLAVYQGDYVEAQTYQIEAYRLRLPLGDPQRMIVSMQNLGDIALDTDLPELATQFHSEGIRLAQQIGDRTSAAYGFLALGEVETDLGHVGRARRFLTRALDIFGDIGDELGMGFLCNTWGYLAQQQGDYRSALKWQKRALGHWQRCNNRRGQVAAIEAASLALFALGRFQVTADLLSGAQRIRGDERMGRPPKRTPPLQRVADALEAIGYSVLDSVPTPMSLDQIVAHTLRLDPVLRRSHRPRRVRPGGRAVG